VDEESKEETRGDASATILVSNERQQMVQDVSLRSQKSYSDAFQSKHSNDSLRRRS